jgi:NADP-dependent 3-hydroxy acid dehydrogenase YdfG
VTAAGGEAVQHPDHCDLAGRGRDRTAQQHHRPRHSERIRKVYSIAISADSFASMAVFAMSQPEDVDVNEILFRPTKQEY